ncbi:hypothetical protein GJ496_003788 [Pomphorhynchus laevis]|nr:hypothetical protein GJ496_003788 [Pomphorhynchus laevis]
MDKRMLFINICHQVLDLLTSPPGKDEEPAVEIESNSNHKCQQQFENETPLSYSSGTNLIPQGNFNSFHQSITTAQQITTPAASCHPALNINDCQE